MNRTLTLLVCLAVLAVGWITYSKTTAAHSIAGYSSLVPKVEGSKVYLVPMGNFPTDNLQTLAQYYRDKYQLDITILKSIPIDPSTRDGSRQQLMAESLAQSVRSGVAEHANDPMAILGFTSEDLYPHFAGLAVRVWVEIE